MSAKYSLTIFLAMFWQQQLTLKKTILSYYRTPSCPEIPEILKLS